MQNHYFKVENLYFNPSRKKFIFLSFITYGLYTIYWAYRNWKVIKNNRDMNVSYLFRSLFFIFFSYSFFNHVYQSAKEKGYEKQVDPMLLCIFFTFVQLVSIGTSAFSVSSFSVILDYVCLGLSILPFLKMLDLMGFYNSVVSSNKNNEPDSYTKNELIIIVFGMIITLYVIYQFFSKL